MNFKKFLIKAMIVPVLTAGTFSFATAQNKNIVMRSKIAYQKLSNIWGYVDTTGREYALVGANNALSIVDVTNPDAPFKRTSVPGPVSDWREIRTWGKYAYVTTEGGGGVTIVDLSRLPDTVTYKQYKGNGAVQGVIDQIHALHIDNGKLYLYGGNYQGGRAKVFSLSDPWNPVYLGTVSSRYVHDGFVKNDTLYSCQIYNGLLEIIDATNPANPVVINSQVTPGQFTHNSWLSTDKKVIYTTDEVTGSWVTAYDISDMTNIRELGRYQSNPGSGSIGHNTYVLNNAAVTGSATDYLVTSYYRDGITIVDASRPDNLVEVGNYDSSPQYSGDGFNGAWGVYPFLPSGNLLISDIENGMYVVTPTYQRACFLEGVVRDATTNQPIPNVKITATSNSQLNANSKLNGTYRTGTAIAGVYSLTVTAAGYDPKTIDNVVLINGQVTSLDILMGQRPNFVLTGLVKDSSGNAIANADILIQNAEFTIVQKTNQSGVFTVNPFFIGNYQIYAGKAGWKTVQVDSASYASVADNPVIVLEKGFYDDFLFDNQWTVTSTAPRGMWERGIPIGTYYNGQICNPDKDADDDIGEYCFVTGNGGGTSGNDDLDNGNTILTSPLLDLTDYTNPAISYQRWFVNTGGTGTPNDTLIVKISDGITTKIIEKVLPNDPTNGTWVTKVVPIETVSSSMRIIFEANDDQIGHIVEAGVDKVELIEQGSNPVFVSAEKNNISLNVYPNPLNDHSVIYYKLNTPGQSTALVRVEVISVLGELVQTELRYTAEGLISIKGGLAPGMYTVRLISGNQMNTVKMIK